LGGVEALDPDDEAEEEEGDGDEDKDGPQGQFGGGFPGSFGGYGGRGGEGEAAYDKLAPENKNQDSGAYQDKVEDDDAPRNPQIHVEGALGALEVGIRADSVFVLVQVGVGDGKDDRVRKGQNGEKDEENYNDGEAAKKSHNLTWAKKDALFLRR